MQQAIFGRVKNSNKFDVIKENGQTIFYLSYFLTDAWVECIESYISWALEPEQDICTLNVAFLEKDNYYILIGSQLSDQEDWGPFFKVSIQEFVKLLPVWKKLVESNAETITLTDNNGIIEISGNCAIEN